MNDKRNELSDLSECCAMPTTCNMSDPLATTWKSPKMLAARCGSLYLQIVIGK